MYETPEDMTALQRLLDDSYAGAGCHLRRIAGRGRRLEAAEVVAELDGIKIMALATAGASGDPRVGPVDGHFYRGRFHFGSSPDSVRVRHIGARPAVSATVFDAQWSQITVHGRAVRVSPTDEPALEQYLIELHGRALWDGWLKEVVWVRIEPETMFAFRNSATGNCS
ncbi:pyridoxamine 5'-phosphate oxidase family protein [Streptomyces sp. URMC 126]|uniref:pyridoxamine 5'-phosphate oxidase family protein n=1 Tax=Streptomyces sp. URMC 126 TaxID=3423401 RepID=UPI003F1B2178